MNTAVGLENLLKPIDLLESGKPVKHIETSKTLNSYHNNYLKQISDEKNTLVELKKTLEAKKEELCRLDLQLRAPSFITTTNDIGILCLPQKLESEIQELQTKIAAIESGANVADYFLRVGDILFSYSEAQERIATGETHADVGARKGRIPTNSVYSYFMPDTCETATNFMEDAKAVKASEIFNDIGYKRDKALESFLNALNPDSLAHDNAIAHSINESYGNCPICETEMLINETYLDCASCGHRDMILVDSEKPSYKDPPREMAYYAYKKINHLNEWLAQFQAKESTEISPAVLEQIRQELRKERITDMSKLKPSKLKEVIKKLKLNRCYDHVAHVLNRLNGISAPVLSRELEEKLRFMFKEIQFSFVKHCPKKRSNFLSYSYVLYKFCELLELDDYLPCFPLLKSREKLYMQDKIWQKICEDMGWEFIRTV
jgi:Zn finger protein HypA/HybF involved in hydrogenase expression